MAITTAMQTDGFATTCELECSIELESHTRLQSQLHVFFSVLKVCIIMQNVLFLFFVVVVFLFFFVFFGGGGLFFSFLQVSQNK